LAAQHHTLTPSARTFRTHPPHARRPRQRTRRAGLVAAAVAAVALLGAPAAHAAPADRVAEARTTHAAAATQVAAIGARVTEAEQTLQRMTIEAEAAGGQALAAQAALATAQQEATVTAAELAAARRAVRQTKDEVSTIGREVYMGSEDAFGDVAILLDADSPTDVLQQAATLEVLGEERTEALGQMRQVEAREARADAAARNAVAERDQLARAAAEAQATADAHLAAARGTVDAVTAEKAALEAQLREAEIQLLTAQGAADAEVAWASKQAAAEAAKTANTLTAEGGAVAPTSGRVTSCYGSRWGTLHAGIDIAAPIGTPVFAPEDGIVLQAGPARGFGLAVAVQHGDGSITLYGHVNRMFVSSGEVVTAGQQMAEVGNRGQSTGPHLHFEVHSGGLFAGRNNPVPWLKTRGISLGGGC
jgi:murein DD-endopeptidase MepM/ murein hydrolase activator NlpD